MNSHLDYPKESIVLKFLNELNGIEEKPPFMDSK